MAWREFGAQRRTSSTQRKAPFGDSGASGEAFGRAMNGTVFHDFPKPQGRTFAIGDAVLIQALLSFGYCALVILGSGAGGAIAATTRSWIDSSSPLTNACLFAMPEHHHRGGVAFEDSLYRHIVAASTFVSIVLFGVLHRHRSQWAASALVAFWQRREQGFRVELARTGYYRMGLGIMTVSMILLYGDGALASFGDFVFTQSWTFFRAPLLCTLAFAFACYASALRWAA